MIRVASQDWMRQFDRDEAPNLNAWVFQIEQLLTRFQHQNQAEPEVFQTEVRPEVEHSLLFRRLMTDYWAAALMQPNQVFASLVPGSADYSEIKGRNEGQAARVVGLLGTQRRPQDVFDQLSDEYYDAPYWIARIGALVFARFQLGSLEYANFLIFEYGAWYLTNRAVQRAAELRMSGAAGFPWDQGGVEAFVSWTHTKLIPRIYHFKRGKSWDEIDFRVGVR